MDVKEPFPDPQRWAVEIYGVEKHFRSWEGLPMGWDFDGHAQWVVSNLFRMRRKARWCRAVDGVDLQVGRGELLGLLGPNGAGKTTLLKCLTTLLEIDRGEAFVNGFNVRTEADQARLSMNLVGSGQWTAFHWELTVAQNLHFFASLYGLDRAERQVRVEQTLEKLGMAHLASERPQTLSAGERQRMLLAKGFMIRTPVFFLDEPTVGLDPEGAREVREFIQHELIGREGTSGILTTHRMPEAETLCHRIAIMDRGRIVACGTPHELKKLAGLDAVIEVSATVLPEAAVNALRQVPGVRSAVAAAIGSEGLEASLRVHGELGDAFETQVVDTLRSRGTQVRSVEREEPTLEDAFIALTSRRLE